MTEIDALIILNAITGLTNSRIRKLIEYFGSAKEVLAVTPQKLLDENLITSKMYSSIAAFNQDAFLKKEQKLIEQHHVRVISQQDESYPELLKNIPDAPLLLYWKGVLEKVDNLAVAIVGSRKASVYGLNIAGRFAEELSEFGISVISGMARGIDTIAHKGALSKKGSTVAVLGSGLANIYPKENTKLFHQITETGAVISEFPMSTDPISFNFPRRNRIISGMSLGIIVVEAFERSGALITSRLALEQGREVFALPGNINSPGAKGTNKLIREGAKLITSLQDVLEELKPQMQGYLELEKKEDVKEKVTISKPLPDLSVKEEKVYEILSEEPVHIDMLVHQSAMSISELSSVILGLELQNLIKLLPGKHYVKM